MHKNTFLSQKDLKAFSKNFCRRKSTPYSTEILKSYLRANLHSRLRQLSFLLKPAKLLHLLWAASKYANHLLQAQSQRAVSSPFVQDFCQNVLWKKTGREREKEASRKIEALRQRLSQNHNTISLTDWGAGFGGNQKRKVEKKISDIAQISSRHQKEGELLYRICDYYRPQRMIELGTNLGIGTLYQALGNPAAEFATWEGDEALAKQAGENWRDFGIKPRVYIGEFSETFKTFPLQDYKPDYVFLDGNHTYQATVDYFGAFLPYVADGSILVFDDIYWSKGMEKAWKEIVAHPDVTISIDTFFLGICFIRRKEAKAHFVFR